MADSGMTTHRLDWGRRGLSDGARRVVQAFMEALLADEDEAGRLVPGPAAACARSLETLDDCLGRSSPDLRRGFAVLAFFMEWLPLFVIGAAGRMSGLPLDRRLTYLEKLETSRVGWLAMLFVAFKVPLAIPAFEVGDELALTGVDRDSTLARRRLPVAAADVERSPRA
jgi:hypothetical protein